MAASVLPRKYREVINAFRAAKALAIVRRRDCRHPLPFGPGEVDHILCSHLLEYLYQPDMLKVLREFHRVLRPGGTVHIILPDLAYMARGYVQGGVDADEFQRQLMLHPEQGESLRLRLLALWNGFGLTHQWMYDTQTASYRVARAGFTVVDDIETPSSFFRADDDGSLHVVGLKPSCERQRP
jgi:predicted SAM-dependent methyltransferase